MKVNKPNKFKEFFKRFGVYVAAGVIVLAVSLTFAITAIVNSNREVVDVGGNNVKFSLPMNDPSIIKDFSSTTLQENTTLNQWEAHLALDLTSEDGLVYSVLDGTVSKVGYEYNYGNYVEITHANGLVSYYYSLGKDLLVKQGDKVVGGTQIGSAAKSASDELDMGNHLHFYMTLDDNKVDPNNYLDLQNK